METVGQRILRTYEKCGRHAPAVSTYVDRSGLNTRCASRDDNLGEGAMGYVLKGENKGTLVKVTRSANAVASEWPKTIEVMHRIHRSLGRRPAYAKLALPDAASMTLCSIDTLVHRRSVMPLIQGRSLAVILEAVYDKEQEESLYYAPADDPFMEKRSSIPIAVLVNLIAQSPKFETSPKYAATLDGVEVADDSEYDASIRALADTDFEAEVDEYHARRLRLIAPVVEEFDRVMSKVLAIVHGMQTADPATPYYHNDLHEENIIVEDTGAVWIIDWDEVSTTPRMPLMETALLHVACQRNPKFAGLLSAVHDRVANVPEQAGLSEELFVNTMPRDTLRGTLRMSGGAGRWMTALSLAAVTVAASVAGSFV
jgi:Phosphotransferase enzyme family